MPGSDRLARFNRRLTNPLLRPLAGRLPPLAIVVHRGRTSGRSYRTPVMAFADGDGWAIALTYGPDRDWVKNVLAAGGATLERRGRPLAVVRPTLVGEGEGMPLMPAAIRPVLRRLGVTSFLRLRADGGPAAVPAAP